MSGTRMGDAIDALVALFTTALAGEAIVHDGAEASMDFADDWMVVGGDGPIGVEESAARTASMWSGLGVRTRDEVVTVTCAVGSSAGDGTVAARRARAIELFDLAEAALRADPGLDGLCTGAAEMSEAELHYLNNAGGVAASLVFAVGVPIRLPA